MATYCKIVVRGSKILHSIIERYLINTIEDIIFLLIKLKFCFMYAID